MLQADVVAAVGRAMSETLAALDDTVDNDTCGVADGVGGITAETAAGLILFVPVPVLGYPFVETLHAEACLGWPWAVLAT